MVLFLSFLRSATHLNSDTDEEQIYINIIADLDKLQISI